MTSMEERAEEAGGGAGRGTVSRLAGSEGWSQEGGQLRVDGGWLCIMGLGSQGKRFLVHSNLSHYLLTVFGGLL